MAENAGLIDQQLVVFDLDNEAYGVDFGSVREIIRLREITNVPRTPDFVEGVINLRGKVIPVVELRKRFGLPGADRTKENRIVNVDVAGQEIGMVVDAVTDVLRIPSDSVEPPSTFITAADSGYLRGIVKMDDRRIFLLDLDQVLTASEQTALAEAARAA